MKHALSRVLSVLLVVAMLISVFTIAASAAVNYTHDSSSSTDYYYNLVSKKDWEIAPGISEAEIVLDNDSNTRRQVAHVMVADTTNEYVKTTTSYANMDTSVYETANMMQQAQSAINDLGWNVVGAMNTCLSWYNNYPADHIHEPLGFMMIDGEVLWDLTQRYTGVTLGFPTCVVIYNDERPTDMPKVEMKSITSSSDLNGYEEQVIPCSSGYIVKDGVNLYASDKNHSADNNNSAPRSVVGITADGKVVIMENDGRQSISAGMGMYECAEVMLDLGCTYACNCDGGGSSTFLSKRPGASLECVNSPSDGSLRETTNGILFVSTAPSDGEFAIAHISSEDEYYTPNSTVTFSAIGTDLSGTEVDIPDDVVWSIAEEGMGTIEDGVFVSNGTPGTVTAQMEYNGQVVGSASIQIVVPEIGFTTSKFTVKYGTEANLTLVATTNNGINEVVLNDNDYTITVSNPALGTINGNVFTAATEATAPAVKEGTLTVTLNCDPTKTGTAQVAICAEITETLFDFEGNVAGNWCAQEISGEGVYASYGKNYYVEDATAEDGQVHNGTGSMRLFTNQLNAKVFAGTKDYYQLCIYPKESIVLNDVQSYGVWVYIDDEMYAHEFNFRYFIDSNNDGVFDTVKSVTPWASLKTYNEVEESGWYYLKVDVGGKKILLPGNDVANYVTSSVSKVPNYSRFIQILAYPHTSNAILQKGTVNGKYDVYFDNFTVDYAADVADRTNPTFGNVTLLSSSGASDKLMKFREVVDTNDNKLSVTANVSDSGDGLNAATAKAYVDGKLIQSSYQNGKISISNVTVANGIHRVKFEICDRAGNKSVVVRQVNVDSSADISTIKVEPKDATLDRLACGSVYWVDLKATDIDSIKSVSTTIDINSSNHWELEHMEVAEGFSATYDVNDETNTADITITRDEVEPSDDGIASTGANETVLASLPIRIISFAEDIQYAGHDEQTYWTDTTVHFWAQDLKLDVDKGEIEYVDGYESAGIGTFSNSSFSVDTEMFLPQNNMVSDPYYSEHGALHVHSTENVPNKAATCTEDGFSGRTYCAGCDSIVDWGTTIPATGHTYDFVEGVLQCTCCAEKFNGIYKDGKTYVDGLVISDGWHGDKYYKDGVQVTGIAVIDGVAYDFGDGSKKELYTGYFEDEIGWRYFSVGDPVKGFLVQDDGTHYFAEKTGYAPKTDFTLANRTYRCLNDKGLTDGAWDISASGKRFYYSYRYYKNTWHEVDGDRYYFPNSGYALTGKNLATSNGVIVGAYEFDNDGKLIGPITGVFKDAGTGTYYYAIDGVQQKALGLVKIGNDYYYCRSNGVIVSGRTWYVEKNNPYGFPEGSYTFGEDGKMVILNGVVETASGYIYYINGVPQKGIGLVEWNGDYYYVRSTGYCVAGRTWYIPKENVAGVAYGSWMFADDAKLILKDGIVAEDSKLHYYVKGALQKDLGLFKLGSDFYYCFADGKLAQNENVNLEDGNIAGLPAGSYPFDNEGKLGIADGIYEMGGILYYYKDGVMQQGLALFEFDGAYYYNRSNGTLVQGRTWYLGKDNVAGVAYGSWMFAQDGKLINKDGIVAENDKLYYYVKGAVQETSGLFKYANDFYYGNGDGTLAQNTTKYLEEGNIAGLPAGTYSFDNSGKLGVPNGIYKIGDEFYYYVDGVQQKGLGLIEFEGAYYYNRSNGIIVHGRTWYIGKGNVAGVPAGSYMFGDDGKMVLPE